MRQLIRRAMAVALPRRMFMTSGPPASGAIALTFDDGPHPEHTPAILDTLRALGTPATFFVVGRAAEAHPKLLERMVREGHALGHHSYAHRRPRVASERDLVADLRRATAALERISGTPPQLFRPPFGELTPGSLLRAWLLGQSVVLWNRDPKDLQPDLERTLRWCNGAPLMPGDIVLLHDDHALAVPALKAVVARARGLGLRFTTVAEWRNG